MMHVHLKKLGSCLAGHKIPNILWNLKVHHHGHNRPPLAN